MEPINESSVKFLISDKDGFESLFHTFYTDLCSYAHHFLKDSAAAEEIVQDIFFKLWTKRDSLEIRTSIKSYLYQSTKNRCLNLIKHIEVRENYKSHNYNLRSQQESQYGNEMEESELNEKIQKAINELPTERQKIFRLSRFEDLKYKEIAEKLGISVKTVENQMGKALKYLRDELSEYLPIIILGIVNWLNKYI